jgi:hypothetical protein
MRPDNKERGPGARGQGQVAIFASSGVVVIAVRSNRWLSGWVAVEAV